LGISRSARRLSNLVLDDVCLLPLHRYLYLGTGVPFRFDGEGVGPPHATR
jgi:hypothetical protein